MRLLQVLYETYENHLDKVGITEYQQRGKWTKEVTLLPISHSTQRANIEVTLSPEGELLRISVLPENPTLIIPVTQSSSVRGSNSLPHPLHDKLEYVASDYAQVTEDTEKATRHHDYIEQLKEWATSEFSHPTVQAVYRYVASRPFMQDLIDHDLISVDEYGHLQTIFSDETESSPLFRVVKDKQSDAFVRFVIETPGEVSIPPWQDPTLFQSYISFYEDKLAKEYAKRLKKGEAPSKEVTADRRKDGRRDGEGVGLCYITGKQAPLSVMHPYKLRNAGDKAKLISSNDTSGYTFRGRFLDSTEAVGVSYEVSQKAHNALRWLIAKQGKTMNGKISLLWGNTAVALPDVTDELGALYEDDLAAFFEETEQQPVFQLHTANAKKLNHVLTGVYRKLDIHPNDKVYHLILDAATPGRVSVLSFREFQLETYLNQFLTWHTKTSWKHKTWQNNQQTWVHGSPSFATIAQATYRVKSDNAVIGRTIDQLIPCILDNRPLPLNLIRQATYSASNPQFFQEGYEWEEALSVACALNRNHYEQEGYTMAVHPTTDRDYLFGRLLAIADRIERSTYSTSETKRQTNAMRYMQTFSQRPVRTWQIIHTNLLPYLDKHEYGIRQWYIKQMETIMASFDPDAFTDTPLTGKYLLGFYSQRQAFFEKKVNEPTSDVAEGDEEE